MRKFIIIPVSIFFSCCGQNESNSEIVKLEKPVHELSLETPTSQSYEPEYGTTLYWNFFSRHKADSIKKEMNHYLSDQLIHCDSLIKVNQSENSESADVDTLNETQLYIFEFKNAVISSQKSFELYLRSECELLGAIVGTGTGRTETENEKEIELLNERIKFLKDIFHLFFEDYL